MKLVTNCAQTVRRLRRTLGAVRKYWKAGGGITQVNVSQIAYGEILKGKNVLITGGSAGIGLAIAKKCLSEGATVVITGRNEAKLNDVASELNHPLLHTLVWDAADVSICSEKLSEVSSVVGGHLDILVNNAGILLKQSFFSTTEDIWDETYAVNSKGGFFLSQKVSEGWIKDKHRGKIINISSTGGILGATYPYRMTKWDLVGLTKGLGSLLSPHGIIVNGIAPGRIATDMLQRGDSENYFDTQQSLERMGSVVEIAELAVFLMSDAANYIVGQTIVCDGGYTLKA